MTVICIECLESVVNPGIGVTLLKKENSSLKELGGYVCCHSHYDKAIKKEIHSLDDLEEGKIVIMITEEKGSLGLQKCMQLAESLIRTKTFGYITSPVFEKYFPNTFKRLSMET